MSKKIIKKYIEKLLILLAVSLVFLGVEAGISYFISVRYDTPLQDVMTMVGIAFGMIGLMASMKGSSSGASISGVGMKHSDMHSFQNLQHVRMEREGDGYRKNFFKNSVIEYGFYRMAILISGFLLIVLGLLFY